VDGIDPTHGKNIGIAIGQNDVDLFLALFISITGFQRYPTVDFITILAISFIK
jgi:hypothetical protein